MTLVNKDQWNKEQTERLKKELKQMGREETHYFWWLLFLLGVAVITVCAIVFTD